jgi:hypothetical protein
MSLGVNALSNPADLGTPDAEQILLNLSRFESLKTLRFWRNASP